MIALLHLAYNKAVATHSTFTQEQVGTFGKALFIVLKESNIDPSPKKEISSEFIYWFFFQLKLKRLINSTSPVYYILPK